MRILHYFAIFTVLSCSILNAEEMSRVHNVYSIPIHGPIDTPQVYIVRRALKQAITHNIQTVVLDIHTPGGSAQAAMDIMEALDNFKGETISYIHTEAMSAGAFIAMVTHKIYFHPKAIMGASAAINSDGGEIANTLKLKINSYLDAKMRALTKDYPYRASIAKAMTDDQYVLKIENTVLKDKGSLLSLTADEALRLYGKPSQPLLSSGTVDSLGKMLDIEYGPQGYRLERFELTGFEHIASFLKSIAPILMGIGIFLIFIEIQSGGFGLFAFLGIGLLLTVFIANYIAGLSGYEGIIIFVVGLLCIALEIFLLGSIVLGIVGILMVFGGLVWSMTDIWPMVNLMDWSIFGDAVMDLGLALLIALIGSIVSVRFLPRSWLWDKLILNKTVDPILVESSAPSLIGKECLSVTPLAPSGVVEIDGQRYQANSVDGFIEVNTRLVVVNVDSFCLNVKVQHPIL